MTVGLEALEHKRANFIIFTYCIKICLSYIQNPENAVF